MKKVIIALFLLTIFVSGCYTNQEQGCDNITMNLLKTWQTDEHFCEECIPKMLKNPDYNNAYQQICMFQCDAVQRDLRVKGITELKEKCSDIEPPLEEIDDDLFVCWYDNKGRTCILKRYYEWENDDYETRIDEDNELDLPCVLTTFKKRNGTEYDEVVCFPKDGTDPVCWQDWKKFTCPESWKTVEDYIFDRYYKNPIMSIKTDKADKVNITIYYNSTNDEEKTEEPVCLEDYDNLNYTTLNISREDFESLECYRQYDWINGACYPADCNMRNPPVCRSIYAVACFDPDNFENNYFNNIYIKKEVQEQSPIIQAYYGQGSIYDREPINFSHIEVMWDD